MHEKLSGGTGIYSGGGNQSNSVTIKSGGVTPSVIPKKDPVTPSDTTHIVVSGTYKNEGAKILASEWHGIVEPLGVTTKYITIHSSNIGYNGFKVISNNAVNSSTVAMLNTVTCDLKTTEETITHITSGSSFKRDNRNYYVIADGTAMDKTCWAWITVP